MNETLEAPTQVATKTEAHVPQSQEVDDEVIHRLIYDTVLPKPARLKYPPKDGSDKL